MAVPSELRGGRYAVVRPIGSGSQAETFVAVDKREGKLVTVKRFRVREAKAWKEVELAEREALTLRSIDHELLPRYVEHFEEDGALVLVMGHIEGDSLAEIRRRGSLGEALVRRFLGDAARALGYLHGLKPPIVHRDIKPANVIRRKDGGFALVDFGAVRDRLKPEGGSTVVGTFGYMAPEQFQGRASPTSDVYGVGATALAMLTGREPEDLPHEGLAIDVARAVPPSTDPALVRALEVMLEPDPDKRAPSVAEALARGEVETRSARRSDRGDTRERADKRADRREARKARRARRRAQRAKDHARRAHGVGFVPRALANLGLLVAWICVWIVVGGVVPAILLVLSPLFGRALRRAAGACVRGARRAGQAIGRASERLLGGAADEADDEADDAPDDAADDAGEEEERVRVADEVLRRVRALAPHEAQAEAIRRAELAGQDAEAWADEVATREAELWAKETEPHAAPLRRAPSTRPTSKPPKPRA